MCWWAAGIPVTWPEGFCLNQECGASVSEAAIDSIAYIQWVLLEK